VTPSENAPETHDVPDQTVEPETKPEQRTVAIGVCINSFSGGFITLARYELVEYLESKSDGLTAYKATIADSENDQSLQENQIEEFIAQGVDILIVKLVDTSSASRIIDMAKTADTPLIFLDSEPNEEDMQLWDRAFLVGLNPDPRQAGTYQGEIIRDLPDNGDINGDGVVSYVVLKGDYKNMPVQYMEYSAKTLEDAGIQVEELLTQSIEGGWDDAQSAASTAITQFGGKIDVIFCNSDMIAIGAYRAIASADLAVGNDVYLVGVGASMEAVDMVGEGQMTGTLSYDPISLARAAVDVAVLAAEGNPLEKYHYLDYIKVVESTVIDIGGGHFEIIRQ